MSTLLLLLMFLPPKDPVVTAMVFTTQTAMLVRMYNEDASPPDAAAGAE